MLDIGALDGTTYSSFNIKVTSIDLNPQHPLVLKQDFFDRPLPNTKKPDDEACPYFHCLAFSLVLNFVPDNSKRGEMLIKSLEYIILDGFLFIVLPLPCITNSRYFSHESFLGMMNSLGCALKAFKHSRKLGFYLFQKEKDTSPSDVRGKWPKMKLFSKGGMNNFSIVI